VRAGEALVRWAPPSREVIDGLTRVSREDLVRVRLRSHFDGTVGGLLRALMREEKNLDTVAPVLADVASVMLSDPQLFSDEMLPALIRLGPKSAGAVPALVRFLDVEHLTGTNDDGIVLAIDALRSIGPAALDAVPVLKGWASDGPQDANRDWERIRKHALKALEKIKAGDHK
jgi:hypothetical protein